MTIQIINGPNLNLLGVREPDVYGSTSFDDFLPRLRACFPDIQRDYFQSNIEGELIDKLHTRIALADCIRAISAPVVEVHISNVHQREAFRHQSMIAAACRGVICGFGLDSYRLAIESFKR